MSDLRGKRARRRAAGPDLRESALAAYNSGLSPGKWIAPPPRVAALITVATMLHAATREGSRSRRQSMIAQASELAREALTPEELAQGCVIDPIGVQDDMAMIRALAHRVHWRDRPSQLVQHLFTTLAALSLEGSIEEARLRSATLAIGFHWYDDTQLRELVLRLLRQGRALGSEEIIAAAWMRAAGIAYMRGNVPALARHAARAARHAERFGDPRFRGFALMVEGMVDGLRGDLAASTEKLWRAYGLDDHPLHRSNVLGNLGETLYRAGHFAESRAARIAIFRLDPDTASLAISLGGYAVCSAALGDAEAVKWAAAQCIAVVARQDTWPRGTAQGLLGCADACAEIGLGEMARSLYEQGRRIADVNGYHDLRFRPDPSTRQRGERARFAGEAELALESIGRLEPDARPADLILAPR